MAPVTLHHDPIALRDRYAHARPFAHIVLDGLIPDPYFGGGGLHQIEAGGFLKVHADFNVHPKLKLDRRLNMLVYLNKDWREEWGGHLELWSRDGAACRR